MTHKNNVYTICVSNVLILLFYKNVTINVFNIVLVHKALHDGAPIMPPHNSAKEHLFL
jgi:hypothetical protein